MPGPTIAITERGATKAAVDLKQMGDRSSDIRRCSERVRSIYRKSNERRFSDGALWPALAPATVERKARQGLDPRTERATGALYKSLTAPRAKDQVDKRDKTEFRFGTTVPYARYQHGTKNQPRRDLINLTHTERREIDKIIGAYIAKDRRS